MKYTRAHGVWPAILTGIALGIVSVVAVNAVAMYDLSSLQRASNLAAPILILGMVSCFLSRTRVAFFSGLIVILLLEMVHLIRWKGFSDGVQAFLALSLLFEEFTHSANVYFFLGCGAFGFALSRFGHAWRREALLFMGAAALLLVFVWLSNGLARPQPGAWSDQSLVVRHIIWILIVLGYYGTVLVLSNTLGKDLRRQSPTSESPMRHPA